MKITVEAPSRAPPKIAFDTRTDFRRWPDFISGILSVEILTGDGMAPGTRFRETRMMHGRKATEEMTVATVDPPHRFVLTAQNHGARYVATTEVIPESNGSRLRLDFEGTPVTFAARLLSLLTYLFASAVRQQLQADVDALAREADRRAAA